MTEPDELPPNEAAALEELVDLELTRGEPQTHKAIAARLGLSDGTVANIERRALARLARLLRAGSHDPRRAWGEGSPIQYAYPNATIKRSSPWF